MSFWCWTEAAASSSSSSTSVVHQPEACSSGSSHRSAVTPLSSPPESVFKIILLCISDERRHWNDVKELYRVLKQKFEARERLQNSSGISRTNVLVWTLCSAADSKLGVEEQNDFNNVVGSAHTEHHNLGLWVALRNEIKRTLRPNDCDRCMLLFLCGHATSSLTFCLYGDPEIPLSMSDLTHWLKEDVAKRNASLGGANRSQIGLYVNTCYSGEVLHQLESFQRDDPLGFKKFRCFAVSSTSAGAESLVFWTHTQMGAAVQAQWETYSPATNPCKESVIVEHHCEKIRNHIHAINNQFNDNPQRKIDRKFCQNRCNTYFSESISRECFLGFMQRHTCGDLVTPERKESTSKKDGKNLKSDTSNIAQEQGLKTDGPGKDELHTHADPLPWKDCVAFASLLLDHRRVHLMKPYDFLFVFSIQVSLQPVHRSSSSSSSASSNIRTSSGSTTLTATLATNVEKNYEWRILLANSDELNESENKLLNGLRSDCTELLQNIRDILLPPLYASMKAPNELLWSKCKEGLQLCFDFVRPLGTKKSTQIATKISKRLGPDSVPVLGTPPAEHALQLQSAASAMALNIISGQITPAPIPTAATAAAAAAAVTAAQSPVISVSGAKPTPYYIACYEFDWKPPGSTKELRVIWNSESKEHGQPEPLAELQHEVDIHILIEERRALCKTWLFVVAAFYQNLDKDLSPYGAVMVALHFFCDNGLAIPNSPEPEWLADKTDKDLDVATDAKNDKQAAPAEQLEADIKERANKIILHLALLSGSPLAEISLWYASKKNPFPLFATHLLPKLLSAAFKQAHSWQQVETALLSAVVDKCQITSSTTAPQFELKRVLAEFAALAYEAADACVQGDVALLIRRVLRREKTEDEGAKFAPMAAAMCELSLCYLKVISKETTLTTIFKENTDWMKDLPRKQQLSVLRCDLEDSKGDIPSLSVPNQTEIAAQFDKLCWLKEILHTRFPNTTDQPTVALILMYGILSFQQLNFEDDKWIDIFKISVRNGSPNEKSRSSKAESSD